MHGSELLVHLRAEPGMESVPTVVLSADATAGRQADLMSSGVTAYLTKPLDIKQLLDVVDDAIG